MFVHPAHRGRGFARAVLAELERPPPARRTPADGAGDRHRQPAAIALYVSAGYAPMAPFGTYRDTEAGASLLLQSVPA